MAMRFFCGNDLSLKNGIVARGINRTGSFQKTDLKIVYRDG